MAGILDKKERVIDYKITNNGRSQIQDGDIRYVYATFSDSGIVYNKLDKNVIGSKRSISDETQYLPFEVTTKVNDLLNPEFDLSNFIKFEENGSRTESNTTFENAIQKIKDENTDNNNISLSKKLINLKLLDSKSDKNISDITFANETEILKNNSFDFNSDLFSYPTIYNINQEYSELPTLIADKRLSDKTPFKRLVPVNDQDVDLYSDDEFKKFYSNQSDEFFVLREYNEKIENINELDGRDECVVKTINSLIRNPKVYKKEYILKDYSKDDVFIFNMYENNIDTEESYSINKLSFIDLGNIFDKSVGKNKRIFLIGKIVKSRNENDIDIDLVYGFNNGSIQKNTNSSQIPLSIYYSFINMFTLVLE